MACAFTGLLTLCHNQEEYTYIPIWHHSHLQAVKRFTEQTVSRATCGLAVHCHCALHSLLCIKLKHIYSLYISVASENFTECDLFPTSTSWEIDLMVHDIMSTLEHKGYNKVWIPCSKGKLAMFAFHHCCYINYTYKTHSPWWIGRQHYSK